MTPERGPDGVLVVDKPAGITSHDVVDRVRKVFGTRKVGHAGTLDPDATGVLVVGVGRATRLLDYSKDAPKRYLATARLGISTSTQDASGDVVAERAVNVDRESVDAALEAFRGPIDQVPPMVSAVKIGGERLHVKARRGEEVERPARRVTIHRLELTGYSDDPPEVGLDVTCSAGTYVRTLAHDLGERLGCGAHLTMLRRVEAGGFTEEDAVPLAQVGAEHLLPLPEAVRTLPRVDLDAPTAALVRNGRPLDLAVPEELVALISGEDLLAVYRRKGERLVADRVVPQ